MVPGVVDSICYNRGLNWGCLVRNGANNNSNGYSYSNKKTWILVPSFQLDILADGQTMTMMMMTTMILLSVFIYTVMPLWTIMWWTILLWTPKSMILITGCEKQILPCYGMGHSATNNTCCRFGLWTCEMKILRNSTYWNQKKRVSQTCSAFSFVCVI